MKTLRISTVLVLTGLAGCSSLHFSDGPEKAAPGTMLRLCQDAAEDDHSLNEYAAQHANVNAATRDAYGSLLAQLREASIDRCLQQHGAVPRGGVEKLRN